ncbi:MAG: tetratricopeptide repeat protein [Candidatus Marinimicrobia bacterium]|nr:tetratricopeptide repeat protein [Candidatus Neomarinimicrobiota bacterium]
MSKYARTSNYGRLVPVRAAVLIGLLAMLGCGGSYELWQLETKHIWNIFHLSRWVMEMWLIALSTILIIVLSAAITYLHGIRSQDSAANGLVRQITMLIGMAILIITGIKDAFVRVNFWDLSNAIGEVEEILDKFDDEWQRHDLTIPAIRGDFTDNYIDTKNKIRGVRDRLRKKSPKTQFGGGQAGVTGELVIMLSGATMLAASGGPQRDSTFVPQWYADPPKNESAAFITGRASAPGLGDAQSQAAATALEMFTQVIRQSLSLKFGDRQTNQGQAIPSFAAESIKKGLQPYWEKHILNDDFIYNAQDNTFTVFVLVQIDHGLAQDIYDAFVAPSLGKTMAEDVWVQVKEIMSRDVRLTATDLRQRRAGDSIRSHEAGRFAAGYSAFEAGQQQLQSRHYKEAAVKLRAVVDANPGFYQANFNLAQAYQLSGDDKQAGIFYQQAVKLEQNLPTALRDASLYYHLGQHYEQREDSEKALANYNRALQIDPEQAYALRARYYLLRQEE